MSEGKALLTDRQKQIYEFICDHIQKNQYPPTVREIGQAFKISSTNGVRSILGALIKKGYIKRNPKLSRGLEVSESEKVQVSNDTQVIEVPIVGRVAAGSPILAVQNLSGTVTVDASFFSTRQDVFALRVAGDSMIEAGIFDGDLVFAKHQNTAEKGEMVIAQIEDEATVKYFHTDDQGIRLEPANANYQAIRVRKDQDFSIAGKVIGVMRKLNT